MTAFPEPLPTRRADLLARLRQPHTYDLAIIGGGATGLGVALDAALRGLSPVCVSSCKNHSFRPQTGCVTNKVGDRGGLLAAELAVYRGTADA